MPPRAILLISDGARDGGRIDPTQAAAAGEGARDSRAHCARGNAGRGRRGEADRRIRAHHPRAAEPGDAAGALRGDRRRVLHRDRRRAPARGVRGARLPPRRARGVAGDHGRVRRGRGRCSCSSVERCPPSSSRGFRDARHPHRVAGGHARGGARRSVARRKRERVRRAAGVRAGRGPVGLGAELGRPGASWCRVAAHLPSRVHRRRPGRGAHPSRDRPELPRDARAARSTPASRRRAR